ncbi:MAG TPA: metallophosphoesterase family protein [Xanthobacteraceae bacterium]|nr:metallophosphoesterase family protein [Xanthobacteraceae bacterium]
MHHIELSDVRSDSPAVPPGRRVYAVGDIHGRRDLLALLMDRIDADSRSRPVEKPVEIYLGDYIDRGPDSRGVIDLLIARARTRETICLKGNHEALLLQFMRQPDVLATWRHYGALPTLASYGLYPSLNPSETEQKRLSAGLRGALTGDHTRFLASLVPCAAMGDFLFVHAGVKPGIPLSRQTEHDMMWIREDFLKHESSFEKMIVHGHTPVTAPEFRTNRINVDTGAYATGRLSCVVIEGSDLRVLATD